MKMLRKGLGIVLMTLLLVICFNTNSKAAGDNMSTAIPVNLNKTIYGNMGYNMDTIRKYYKFTLPQNSIVKLYIKTGASDQHVDVELRDSTGEGLGSGNGSGEYLETDDDKNWGFQSAEDRVALNAGTYYLRLLSYDDTNYEMKVSVVTKASDKIKIAGFQNYNRSKALPISIGNKIVGIAEWDFNYENKYFKFKVPTSRTVNMKFYTEIEKYQGEVGIQLTDSDGDEIAEFEIRGKDGKNTEKFSRYLKKGTYYICVRSTDHQYFSIKTAYKPYSTKVTSLKSTSKKTMTVKWKKKSPTAGYQIQYSRNSNFKNAKSIKVSASKGSKKITGLTRGKKYYVRVRRYTKSFGLTYYSKWSTKKSVKIK